MPSARTREELLQGLHDAVVNYDEESASELSRTALFQGVDAYDAVVNGLAAGMETVGELFDKHEYFVPEMLMCADALYAGLNVLRPHIKSQDGEVRGQVVIVTVEGDVPDIGKNLVKMMFEAAGWTVHDLGTDVKLEKFIEEQMRTDSDVVALSALMTTSMIGIPEIIRRIKAKNPNVAIMVGGAPMTEDVVKQYGADGYAKSAGNAVQEAIKMISQLRKQQVK